MANMFKMMKQAASMQKEMKTIQKSLAKKTVDFSSPDGKITVVVRGDMTVQKIDIQPEACEAPDKLGKQLTTAINSALEKAKKEAGGEMSKLASGMGLGDMLGG